MRCFATVPTVLLGLATIGTGAALVAPGQTHAAGLDFWRVAGDAATLQGVKAEGQELEFELELQRQRAAVGDRIAVSLCEDRITFPEALESVAELARSAPDWFARVRGFYHASGEVPRAGTDWDVMAHFLCVKIERMFSTAERSGNAARAAFLSARLGRLREEVRLAALSKPSGQQGH